MVKHLLEIRVDDLDSVPQIIYKGKRIPNALIHVGYEWKTSDNQSPGSHVISLEYVKDHENKHPEIKAIKRERL